MKLISVLRQINRVLMLITVMLYITVVFGLIFQVVLGGFQIIAAIILLILWYDLEKRERVRLLYYWLMVLTYGICIYMKWFDFIGHKIFQMAIFPIAIAGFFTFILEKLTLKEPDLE